MNHKPLVHWHHRNTPRPSALCGKRTLCSVSRNTKRLPPIHVNSNVPIDYRTPDERHRSIAAMFRPPSKLNALDRLLASRNPRRFLGTQPTVCLAVLGKFQFWRHRHSRKEEINEFSRGKLKLVGFLTRIIFERSLEQDFHVMNLSYSSNSISKRQFSVIQQKKTSNS